MAKYDNINESSSQAAKNSEAEIKEIRESVDSLKTNVVGLARNLKDISAERAHAAADYVRDQVDGLKVSGAQTLEKAESTIKARPARSVALAFASGIVVSYLLGRKA